jgi:hypothetical protein
MPFHDFVICFIVLFIPMKDEKMDRRPEKFSLHLRYSCFYTISEIKC